MSDESDELIGALIKYGMIFIAVITVVIMVVMAAAALAGATMTFGGVYGAGVSLRNYIRAFARNVRPAKVAV
jgi:hypothetical protein